MDKQDTFSKVKHLYNRGGFGISFPELQEAGKRNLKKAVDHLFEQAELPDAGLTTTSKAEHLAYLDQQAMMRKKKNLATEEREQQKVILRTRNQQKRALNTDWMDKMIKTSSPLLEKMTLFWHGHFACRSNNPYYAQQLNNIQRTHALGSFRTLLKEVSQSPAMLQYLNNQQNKKNSPNENFARELMELFTLGRGHYTEQDVKESARAFTGWMYTKDGDFEFREKQHDAGVKTFLSKTGNFDGDDILDIILKNRAAAEYICSRLYVFFVNDKPDPTHIKTLSDHFYKNDYHIGSLMRKLFESPWFYDKANIGVKIKSPAELLVGLSRTFYVSYQQPQVLIQLQTSLGQYLFNPPNVAGWPGGKSWIDSSSLLLRMKIPSLVLNDGFIDFSGKADPEDEALIAVNRQAKVKKRRAAIRATADWNKFLSNLPANYGSAALADYLLQTQSAGIKDIISGDATLKNVAIAITSTPEYQLC